MTIKTLANLKTLLNQLNDEQLSQEALLYLVDQGAEPIATGIITSEDEYLTDEGYCPVSTFEPEDDDDKLDNYEIRPAGYFYLLNE